MQDSQMKTDVAQDARQGFNLLMAVVHSHSACLLVFIRCGFGTEYPGINALFAILLMMLYTCGTECPKMLLFMAAWFIALVLQRFITLYLWVRGVRDHSRYGGHEWLARLLPFTKTEYQARNVEPVLCLVLGIALLPWSPDVGVFVASGVVSLTLERMMYLYTIDRKAMAMRDLKIEQQILAHRIRELDG